MGNRVVKVDWDQKVQGLDYQARELGLYSVDNGELLKVFSRKVTSSELCLRKINLATVSIMDWSRERPEDTDQVGDYHSRPGKDN